MIQSTLTGKAKRFLRALGSKLAPILSVGREGVTPTVVQAARDAIQKHELIKIRVQKNAPEEPTDAIERLAERAGAEIVQRIGRNGLLWKRNPQKPKIDLP